MNNKDSFKCRPANVLVVSIFSDDLGRGVCFLARICNIIITMVLAAKELRDAEINVIIYFFIG